MNVQIAAAVLMLMTGSGVKIDQGRGPKTVKTQAPVKPSKPSISDHRGQFLIKLNQLLDLMEKDGAPAQAVEIMFATLNQDQDQDAVVVILESGKDKTRSALLFLYQNQDWSLFPESFE